MPRSSLSWELAKRRKLAGDDTLYNTLGDARCVASLVAKMPFNINFNFTPIPHHITPPASQSCELCGTNIFRKDFYAFPCHHVFKVCSDMLKCLVHWPRLN